MFSQSKKQTTLNFGPKPSATANTISTPRDAKRKDVSNNRNGSNNSNSNSSAASLIHRSARGNAHSSQSAVVAALPAARVPSVTPVMSPYFRGAAEPNSASRKRGFSVANPTNLSDSKRPRSDAIPNHSLPPAQRAPSSTMVRPTSLHTERQSRSDVVMSEQQCRALHLVVTQRQSVFITGSAGTGKSLLMAEIIQQLRDNEPLGLNTVAVTAPTGIAAFHIGGQTLHSFAGIGLGKGPVANLLRFVEKNKNAKERWRRIQTLVIDEISMLDAELFDKLEHIAREIRGNSRPFGGIQLVITGDFYQLPPVTADKKDTRFAFEAGSWPKCVTHTVVLTQVFRQKDMAFIDMLNDMRVGHISPATEQKFKSLARAPSYPDDGIQPTELYALRQQVHQANERRLKELPGTTYKYVSDDGILEQLIQKDPQLAERIEASSMMPKILYLKKNAQVMLVKNMPDVGLVNGSRGVVTRFLEIEGREYPVCRFTNGVELTIMPETWTFEMNNKEYKRVQIPLVLAWALSIHKSQGQTIDRVIVDLGKVFEKGQAYVALSRATSLNGLQILNFRRDIIMAHPRVVKYYATLASKCV